MKEYNQFGSLLIMILLKYNRIIYLIKIEKKQEIYWLHKRIKDDLGLRKYEKLAKSKKIKELEHELNTNTDTLDNIINKL